MLCTNCDQEEIYAKGECNCCYRYRLRTGIARPPRLYQKNIDPADDQRRVATSTLRNTITNIKRQGARLNADQASIIYDLCQALKIEPTAVLGKTMNLIDPPKPTNLPLIQRLDQEPKLMKELGRMLAQ